MPGLYAKEDDFPVTRELGYASWLNRVLRKWSSFANWYNIGIV